MILLVQFLQINAWCSHTTYCPRHTPWHIRALRNLPFHIERSVRTIFATSTVSTVCWLNYHNIKFELPRYAGHALPLPCVSINRRRTSPRLSPTARNARMTAALEHPPLRRCIKESATTECSFVGATMHQALIDCPYAQNARCFWQTMPVSV